MTIASQVVSQVSQAFFVTALKRLQTLSGRFDSKQYRGSPGLPCIDLARQFLLANRPTCTKIANALLLVSSLAASLLLPAVSTMAADLTVVVENIKSADGTIRVGLFTTQDSFPKKAQTGLFSQSKAGVLSFVFPDLAPGNYAISAFHDVNKNQKLDTNFFGKPVEPYGFSRSARGKFGPPSFDDAQFQMDAHPKSISITLK